MPQSNAYRKEDLAWAAGFFDGEGCVCINKLASRKRWTLKCRVSQVDMQPLLKLKSMFGGCIVRHYNQAFSWELSAVMAMTFLSSIRAFVKRDRVLAKIRLASEFQSQKSRNAGTRSSPEYLCLQEEFFQKMKFLNRRQVNERRRQ